MCAKTVYLHGTDAREQARLTELNRLTNAPFVDFLGIRPGETVLEVGSGLGILAEEVSRKVGGGRVVGVERASEQLEATWRRAHARLEFVRGDAHALGFPDSSFDLVYCRYLLEHVADPAQVLREMRRVLKEGGRAAVQENDILVARFDPPCPRFDSLWARFVELQRRLGGDALIGRRLFRLFREVGFRRIVLSIQPEVHWSGSPGFGPWIENLIGNLRGAAASLAEHGLARPGEVAQAEEELRSFARLGEAAAFFYWNRARADK